MLFNSYEFIFVFFPAVVIGFFLIARYSHHAAAIWLGLMSLFFYGYWSAKLLPLLLCSIVVNYQFGHKLVPAGSASEHRRKIWLYVALATNLAVLGYYKYANFFIGDVNAVLQAANIRPLHTLTIVLPIGISFFTFTQIAFLVDCWQGKVKERRFTHYLLFVSYFPHLIAGPILHHAQMMPQFARSEIYRPNYDKIAIGLTFFTIGLAKKLLIADPVGAYANVFFDNVSSGATLPVFFASWLGTLAFTWQIYFDFSGYSDMAIGLSLFFGVAMPINFNSPYKATNIIDFWRRWHISLSTFLRDYLYIPLGGNRLGAARRYVNLMVTMLLGGLWHGANWTFVLWGAMHGVFLVVNHLYRQWTGSDGKGGVISKVLSWLMTFICVCFAWVLFRADSLATAGRIYQGMLGANGFDALTFDNDMLYFIIGAVILSCPSVASRIHKDGGVSIVHGKYSKLNAVAYGVLFALSVFSIKKLSPFIYFNF